MKEPNEQYYRLKYHYFIDADNITEEILASKQFKNYNKKTSVDSPCFELAFEELLDLIFKTILEYSKPYTDFLDHSQKSHQSFFGEGFLSMPPCTHDLGADYSTSSYKLLNLSIENHFILESFFKYLSGTEPNHFKKTICFNSKDSHYFEYGYFDWEQYCASSHHNPRESYGTKYRATYIQRLNSFNNRPNDYYSKKLLIGASEYNALKPTNSKRHAYITVPSYQHIYLHFLYSNRAVHYFDKAIAENLPLAHKYNSLYEEALGIENTLSNNLDKLLFLYPLEKAYGFTTFKFLIKQLKKIRSTEPIFQKRTLGDLNTNLYFDIAKLYLKCPMVYNRSFILKYACNSILYADEDLINHNHRYLETPIETLSSKLSDTSPSKTQLIGKGLNLMEQYILLLNRLIFPLLTDLWEITIQNLNDHISNSKITFNLDTFSQYINKNFDILTFDFSQLSQEEICNCYHYGENMDQFRQNIRKFISNETDSKNNSTIVPIKHLKKQTIAKWENILRSYIKNERSIIPLEESINTLCQLYDIHTSPTPNWLNVKREHVKELANISTNISLAINNMS